MRGKPLEEVAKYGAAGITPADAGKTTSLFRPARRLRDHPRGCGENYILNCEVEHLAGSPPRMRGKRGYNLRYALQHGDHPRGCGEN